MTAILFVRIKSSLDQDDLVRRMNERLPSFRPIPGLIQKIFGRDEASGTICGIYFFETRTALDAYRVSDLAKSIPEAYEATAMRAETFELTALLHPERDQAQSGSFDNSTCRSIG